jgi:hypothetical protein
MAILLAHGEIRLWQFGLDNEGVIRCFQDEMIRPPFNMIEKQQDPYFVIIILKMFNYSFIISYIL